MAMWGLFIHAQHGCKNVQPFICKASRNLPLIGFYFQVPFPMAIGLFTASPEYLAQYGHSINIASNYARCIRSSSPYAIKNQPASGALRVLQLGKLVKVSASY